MVHGRTVAVREVSLSLARGRVTALMGRNGSGKSSLLWALQGSGPRRAGRVDVGGADPADLKPAERRALVGLLPQSAADLLYLETVDEECAAGGPRLPRASSTRWCPGIPGDRHPRDLSEGQRLALALALVLAGQPPVVLLDEPTRGLDYARQAGPGRGAAPARRRRAGPCWCPPTTSSSSRWSPTRWSCSPRARSSRPVRYAACVAESPAFAPQVTKVLGPPWLRVDEVTRALEARAMNAVPVSRRSALVLAVASLGGLMMLVWPLLLRVSPRAGSTRRSCSSRCCRS